MPTLTYSLNVSGAGSQITQTINRTVDGVDAKEIGSIVPLAAAQQGTLTTRTDNNTGTITMASGGHTITTGMLVDIYWSTGVQYGVTVGTVSGTSVPIDLGVGDDLPSSTTVVYVAPRIRCNVLIDGDLLSILAIQPLSSDTQNFTDPAHIDFRDASDAVVAALKLTSNIPNVYDIASGVITNPVTGNIITYVMVSNGSPTNTMNIKVITGGDSTP